MDHYSKMILGYRIENTSSALAIKSMIQNACEEYLPDQLQFLTDGGTENVNHTVSGFIEMSDIPIDHVIAQKDVIFSNSTIEALNKVIKHQFLFHKGIDSREKLVTSLHEVVAAYNTSRPQMNLGGNTPIETYQGKPIELSQYTTELNLQKALRVVENRKNACGLCH